MFSQLSSSYNRSISINFSDMWQKGRVPVKSIRVVDLKELALMYDLEDYLVSVDIPLRVDRDIDLFLATKTKKDIFHLAVTMVIRQRGISSKDRFFNEEAVVSIKDLKELTISGSLRKANKLDSLYDLLTFSYRRCCSLFKELDSIDNNKELFYYLCKLFTAIYDMVVDTKDKDFVGSLHVKAILTTIMKLKSVSIVRSYMQVLH